MDRKCSQLLPSVCTILADPRHLISDDTCLEKLLDWLKTLTSAGSGLLLLEENPCLTEFILAVLGQQEPSPSILSFVLRLTGIFAASESCFQHLQQGEVVRGTFGEAGPTRSALWEDASIRSGWVQGIRSMLQHQRAFQFLCNSGALDTIFTLQGDSSLFVASGANQLLAHMLIFSMQSGSTGPPSTKDCNWPACARRIIAHVEASLESRSSSQVKHALQTLTTLFEHSQKEWTEVLWSRIAETVESLLREEAVQAGHYLVDLFLSMARSPAFSCPDCSLWKLVMLALKSFSLAQAAPLALGVLKLEACPPGIKQQALNILLQPMSCISGAASDSMEFSGLLDGPPSNTASLEPLLSSRSSCISLLCQTLARLEETQRLACLSVGFPHKPLLHSVVTVLQFCVGLAVPVSSLGSKISRILIGCFRVQRAALSLLGALSQWASCDADTEQVYDILLFYLKSPDTSSTVLKAAFQATLKWVLRFSGTSGPAEGFQHHKQFLRDVLPILQKRLCSPRWEVRDSALEFLTLAIKHLKEQEWFWQALLSSEVPALAEGLLEDPESYVRASAVKALGQFSLAVSTGSKAATLDSNGSNPEAGIAARLLDILSLDSEGFPRRAAMGVFIDWLREGHPDVMAGPEAFVSRVLQAVSGDLDWEVKVSSLELAEVLLAQTSARAGPEEHPSAADTSPAGQPGRLPELLQLLCRGGLFGFLVAALGDCDRPVALRACGILRAVKAKVCRSSCLEEEQRSDPGGAARPEETPQGAASLLPLGDGAETGPRDPKEVLLLLAGTDLAELQRSLDRSSDHLEKSLQSLLQDILSAAGGAEENEADCY
ncbi:BRCA1-associated ATM activator 1 isoform X1 [Hemicordylus capensis]|nr:BRCA1-associated ATM activator 1 isoform X1 [Hemicordylus capensis]XP_053131716.1 BRCA1-associated ATM activator 1 isoform X1 [Hemicordylus capensis]